MGGQLLSAEAQFSLTRAKPLLPNLDACNHLIFVDSRQTLQHAKKINLAVQKCPTQIFVGSTTEEPPTNRFLLAVICYLIASD
jgi:hypothetical protein